MSIYSEPVSSVNGNGGAIRGRGLRHRKMTRSEAVRLAADMAAGRPFIPSVHQAADLLGVPLSLVSKELSARTAARKETTESEPVILEPEVVITELSIEEVPSKPSALIQAWYDATPEERELFFREEIVRRVIH